jgi:hypothetical protein
VDRVWKRVVILGTCAVGWGWRTAFHLPQARCFSVGKCTKQTHVLGGALWPRQVKTGSWPPGRGWCWTCPCTLKGTCSCASWLQESFHPSSGAGRTVGMVCPILQRRKLRLQEVFLGWTLGKRAGPRAGSSPCFSYRAEAPPLSPAPQLPLQSPPQP